MGATESQILRELQEEAIQKKKKLKVPKIQTKNKNIFPLSHLKIDLF